MPRQTGLAGFQGVRAVHPNVHWTHSRGSCAANERVGEEKALDATNEYKPMRMSI